MTGIWAAINPLTNSVDARFEDEDEMLDAQQEPDFEGYEFAFIAEPYVKPDKKVWTLTVEIDESESWDWRWADETAMIRAILSVRGIKTVELHRESP